MTDLPASALAAAGAAIRHELKSSRDIEPDRLARAALEAAAPLLAETIAQKILAHMEEHGPAPASPGVTLHETMRRAWRRHFGIAARVAAGAFYTREDELRLAAQAIERGDFIACNPPEVPGERDPDPTSELDAAEAIVTGGATDRDERDDHIDQALAAIGGEDTEFYLTVRDSRVALQCRSGDCAWGEKVGEMELWEFVADARAHWESTHAAPSSPVDTCTGG
jgi:hypothetical protein